jgi:hypothetical protein
MKYISCDAEMGGRDLKYSLLQSAFIVYDSNFEILGELKLLTKPDDGNYIVSGQGMEVNGIDLQKHDKIALTYKQAKGLLYDFLKTHSINDHLTPVGHGIVGDMRHFQDKLISEGSWHQFCTYHYIDTSVVLQFLRACGKMPTDQDGSVGALAKYFGIVVDGTLHDAMTDAKVTAAIYQKMIQLGIARGDPQRI